MFLSQKKSPVIPKMVKLLSKLQQKKRMPLCHAVLPGVCFFCVPFSGGEITVKETNVSAPLTTAVINYFFGLEI